MPHGAPDTHPGRPAHGMSDSRERRYNDDEARAIIARASRTQHAVEVHDDGGRGAGFSLAELQAIGREVGLDPQHVAAAAAALAVSEPVPAVDRLGLPTTLRRTRVVPAVSDAAWERIVAELRAEFRVVGNAGQVGRMREWSATAKSPSGARDEVHVVVAPHGQGAAITIEQPDVRRRAHDVLVAAGTMSGMGVILGALSFVALPLVIVSGAILAAGGLMGGIGVLHARRWAGSRADYFERLLDRMELIARAG